MMKYLAHNRNMSEKAAEQVSISPEEMNRQKDSFIQRAVALYEVFAEDESRIKNRVAGAIIELTTPQALRFNMYREDGQPATATTMGRFSDFHSSVGDYTFDRDNPLKIDRITATVKAWLHEEPQLLLTFECDDPAYYNLVTLYGPDALDNFALDAVPSETEV